MSVCIVVIDKEDVKYSLTSTIWVFETKGETMTS
jgi:hypothetical protein